MRNHSEQPRRQRLTRPIAVGLILVAGHAQAQDIRTFDVAQGDLATVLMRIALTAEVSIAFPAEFACGRMAGPVRGREEVETALARALAGTDLEISRIEKGSLTIRRRTPPPADADGLVLAGARAHQEVAGRSPDCSSDASEEVAADILRAVP